MDTYYGGVVVMRNYTGHGRKSALAHASCAPKLGAGWLIDSPGPVRMPAEQKSASRCRICKKPFKIL